MNSSFTSLSFSLSLEIQSSLSSIDRTEWANSESLHLRFRPSITAPYRYSLNSNTASHRRGSWEKTLRGQKWTESSWWHSVVCVLPWSVETSCFVWKLLHTVNQFECQIRVDLRGRCSSAQNWALFTVNNHQMPRNVCLREPVRALKTSVTCCVIISHHYFNDNRLISTPGSSPSSSCDFPHSGEKKNT